MPRAVARAASAVQQTPKWTEGRPKGRDAFRSLPRRCAAPFCGPIPCPEQSFQQCLDAPEASQAEALADTPPTSRSTLTQVRSCWS